MAIANKTTTVNAEAVVLAASDLFASQTHTAGLELSFDPTDQTDFNGSLKVAKTDSSANFSASLSVASEVSKTEGTLSSVLVGADVFTEASGMAHASASGTTVVVSGSIPSGTTVNNVSVDFSEGDRSSYGALVVDGAGNFSATHTYSYPGIYHITTRVQSHNGAVDMDSFRLNMASDLSGTDLGLLTVTATPETGNTSDSSPLSVSFTAAGASGVSLAGDDSSNLNWRFGNLESSSKITPGSTYSEPGTYIPVASFLYEGPTVTLYLSDITSTGGNQ